MPCTMHLPTYKYASIERPFIHHDIASNYLQNTLQHFLTYSLTLTMKSAVAHVALVCTGLATVTWAELPKTWNKDSKWQVEILTPVQLPAHSDQKMVPDAGIWDIDLWHAVKNPSIVDGLHVCLSSNKYSSATINPANVLSGERKNCHLLLQSRRSTAQRL